MNDVQRNFKKQMNKSLKDLKRKDKTTYDEYVKWNHLEDTDTRLTADKHQKIISVLSAPFKIAYRIFGTLIISVLIISFVRIIGKNNTASNIVLKNQPNPINFQNDTVPDNKPALELIEKSSGHEGNVNFIYGIIKNNTSKKYSHVKIEINLYDTAGNQIESVFDSVDNLLPATTWKFKASYTKNEAKSYKIIGITGN